MSKSAPISVTPRPLGAVRTVGTFAATAVLLALAACTGREGRSVDELVLDDGRYLEPETMRPYSGLAFATFNDQPSVVAQRLSLRDGAYHGPFEAYFDNRKLIAREYYENGVRHGAYRWYFEDGELFEEGTFENGLREGPYRAYWDTGDLYEEGTYRNGDFDGPRRWYKDGRMIEEVTYQDGVLHGLYERYREDGSVDLKGVLEQGEPCGIWFEAERTIRHPACGAPSVTE
jgi:hypothetical protein